MTRLAAGLAAAFTLAAAAPAALAALPVGAPAPDFTADGAMGGAPFKFHLAEALKKGPVVLYFFPSAYTTGCTIEAHLFADSAAEFRKQGATLIGVTSGKIDRVADFSKEHCRSQFPVAADPGAKIAGDYKSVLAVTAIPGVTKLSDRTSYVIAPDGKILLAYSDLSADHHVEKTMAAVKAWRAGHPG